MFIPKRRKNGHTMNVVSKKSVKRYVERGLRIKAAKPVLHYHQTLTFPQPILEVKDAKKIFVKFIKQVLKFYKNNEMSIYYVQERRKDGALHYHVSFLFFVADKLPYVQSRIYRDFRTDIFNRWNGFNDFKCARVANKLKEHPFDLDSINYFAKGLHITAEATNRPETNWWGVYNKQYIDSRSTEPTKQEKDFAFGIFFKKSSRNHCAIKSSRIKTCIGIGEIPEAVSVSFVCDNVLPVDWRGEIGCCL
jgi:hypothetical protein